MCSDTPALQVDVNLVRKDEDYTAPAKPKVAAFAGAGRKLGGEPQHGDVRTAGALPA
jgi:hypothetical protein